MRAFNAQHERAGYFRKFDVRACLGLAARLAFGYARNARTIPCLDGIPAKWQCLPPANRSMEPGNVTHRVEPVGVRRMGCGSVCAFPRSALRCTQLTHSARAHISCGCLCVCVRLRIRRRSFLPCIWLVGARVGTAGNDVFTITCSHICCLLAFRAIDSEDCLKQMRAQLSHESPTH